MKKFTLPEDTKDTALRIGDRCVIDYGNVRVYGYIEKIIRDDNTKVTTVKMDHRIILTIPSHDPPQQA